MKKLALIAALTLLSASAHAATYGDGKNRVVIPRGCSSWSCISVSVPGYYSHNVQPAHQAQSRRSSATSSSTTTSATAATTTTVAPTAATNVAPATGGSNVTVLPSPATPAQQ